MKKLIIVLMVMSVLCFISGCAESSKKTTTVVKNAEVTKLLPATTTASVSVGSEFLLPKTIQALMSDNTTTTLQITWDKVADTSKEGIFTFKGVAQNTSLTTDFTLTVTPKATLTITKVNIAATSASVIVGEVFPLPNTGVAVMSDNSTTVVAIKWDKAVDTSKEGTFTFKGSIQNTTITVEFVLTVTPKTAQSIIKVELATTSAVAVVGTAFSLPKTATAVLGDNSTTSVAVTWDKTANTSKEGTFTFKGTIKNSSLTLEFTLVVTQKPAPEIAISDVSAASDKVIYLAYTMTISVSDAKVKSVRVLYDGGPKDGKPIYQLVTVANGYIDFTGITKKEGVIVGIYNGAEGEYNKIKLIGCSDAKGLTPIEGCEKKITLALP